MVIMPNILSSNTDDEILREVGSRLKSYRLQQNLAVLEVAKQAGLNRNTIVNTEAGRNPRLGTLVCLLRVYGRLEALEAFIPAPTISPLQLVRNKGRLRRRARPRRDG
ncbi:MAG: helix-turn-helix domain-containing protein [Gemmatimonadales bacterium]